MLWMGQLTSAVKHRYYVGLQHDEIFGLRKFSTIYGDGRSPTLPGSSKDKTDR
jgi:hypothetical protein